MIFMVNLGVPPIRVPNAVSRAEQTAESLRQMVARSAPGTRLGTKDELRESCGVSVGTFNEALSLVRSEGLIRLRRGPGGGLFVAEQPTMMRLGFSLLTLDADDGMIADAYRMRAALDPLLVEDALQHASPATVEQLREQVRLMHEAYAELDREKYAAANWALHGIICDVCPSPLLQRVYRSLLDLIESRTKPRSQDDSETARERFKQRVELHERLVEAIAVRDSDLAAEAIAAHNETLWVPGAEVEEDGDEGIFDLKSD